MDGIKSLAKAIDAEKVARAKENGIEEKLLVGPRLFAQACEAMRAGTRIFIPIRAGTKSQRFALKSQYGQGRSA